MNDKEESESVLSEDAKKGIGLGAALVLGALAAVGIVGDLLTRMVRNDAWSLRNALWIALGAATILVLTALWSGGKDHWPIKALSTVCVLALAGMAGYATYLGAESQNDREVPSVALSIDSTDESSTLHVVAAGSSLRSDESMLVLVSGLTDPLPDDLQHDDSDQSVEDVCRNVEDFRQGRKILSWTETGPNAKGEVAVDLTMPMPAGEWAGFCALAAQRNRPDDPGDASWTVVYLVDAGERQLNP